MPQDKRLYWEKLSDAFNIQHKVTLWPAKQQYHIHRQLEILYPLSDNLSCCLEEETLELHPGHFFLLNNMDLHCIVRRAHTPEDRPLDRYVLYFAPEYLADIVTPEVDLLECFYAVQGRRIHTVALSPEQDAFARQLLERLIARSAAPQPAYGDDFAQRVEFAALLLLIAQNFHTLYGLEREPADRQLIFDVIDYIHAHYAEPLRTETLARQFLIGKSRLYELFRRVTGTSLYEFVLKYRINKATELLALGYSVSRTGELVGYENQSHFCQIFSQRMGCSPKQYQLRLRSSACSQAGKSRTEGRR